MNNFSIGFPGGSIDGEWYELAIGGAIALGAIGITIYGANKLAEKIVNDRTKKISIGSVSLDYGKDGIGTDSNNIRTVSGLLN